MKFAKILEPTKIRIEQSHIDKGVRCNFFDCPIANALDDVIDPKYITLVSQKKIYLYGGDKAYEWDLTPEIQAIIVEYDNNGNMQPFEFELDIPYKLRK